MEEKIKVGDIVKIVRNIESDEEVELAIGKFAKVVSYEEDLSVRFPVDVILLDSVNISSEEDLKSISFSSEGTLLSLAIVEVEKFEHKEFIVYHHE